jgi:hypothetical protein
MLCTSHSENWGEDYCPHKNNKTLLILHSERGLFWMFYLVTLWMLHHVDIQKNKKSRQNVKQLNSEMVMNWTTASFTFSGSSYILNNLLKYGHRPLNRHVHMHVCVCVCVSRMPFHGICDCYRNMSFHFCKSVSCVKNLLHVVNFPTQGQNV